MANALSGNAFSTFIGDLFSHWKDAAQGEATAQEDNVLLPAGQQTPQNMLNSPQQADGPATKSPYGPGAPPIQPTPGGSQGSGSSGATPSLGQQVPNPDPGIEKNVDTSASPSVAADSNDPSSKTDHIPDGLDGPGRMEWFKKNHPEDFNKRGKFIPLPLADGSVINQDGSMTQAPASGASTGDPNDASNNPDAGKGEMLAKGGDTTKGLVDPNAEQQGPKITKNVQPGEGGGNLPPITSNTVIPDNPVKGGNQEVDPNATSSGGVSALKIPTDLEPVFQKYQAKYSDLPQDYLARTAAIESKFNAKAHNASGADGIMQFVPSTAKHYNVDSSSIDSSLDGAARLAMDNQKALQHAGIDTPTGSQLYLAHQQGAGGAAALINNPNLTAQAALEKAGLTPAQAYAHIKANGGNPTAPAQDFVNHWDSKYNGNEDYSHASEVAAGGAKLPPDADPKLKAAYDTKNPALIMAMLGMMHPDSNIHPVSYDPHAVQPQVPAWQNVG